MQNDDRAMAVIVVCTNLPNSDRTCRLASYCHERLRDESTSGGSVTEFSV